MKICPFCFCLLEIRPSFNGRLMKLRKMNKLNYGNTIKTNNEAAIHVSTNLEKKVMMSTLYHLFHSLTPNFSVSNVTARASMSFHKQ